VNDADNAQPTMPEIEAATREEYSRKVLDDYNAKIAAEVSAERLAMALGRESMIVPSGAGSGADLDRTALDHTGIETP
jgi:hypothetical protein